MAERMSEMRTMNLASIENENARKNFYPTPPALADKLTQGIDWNFAQSVLEPSAGKGDLARVAANKMYKAHRGFPVYDEHSKREAWNRPTSTAWKLIRFCAASWRILASAWCMMIF